MPGSSAQPPMPPLVFWQTTVSTEGSLAVSPILVTLAWPAVARLLASGTRSAPAKAVPPLIASTNAPVNKRALNVDMTTSLVVLPVGRLVPWRRFGVPCDGAHSPGGAERLRRPGCDGAHPAATSLHGADLVSLKELVDGRNKSHPHRLGEGQAYPTQPAPA